VTAAGPAASTLSPVAGTEGADPPVLLTPGPLTTSERTRRAATVDHGSWDRAFNDLTADVCRRLLAAAGATRDLECVPLQGSGTFAVEAAVRTLVPRDGELVVVVNGAYGRRIATTAAQAGRRVAVLDVPWDRAPEPGDLADRLERHPDATHVAVVHCETSTGLLNPVAELADVAAAAGRRVLVDAMSSFGVLDPAIDHPAVDAVVAASGKCLEGLPGMGFVLVPPDVLAASAGNCDSLSLDLVDQRAYMDRTGQWRYTPPTHVVAALREALVQYEEEGGRAARLARYAANSVALSEAMGALGFRWYLDEALRTPIIHTFHAPQHPAWSFAELYELVRARGFILYPGKLTTEETFRVGCIGAITPDVLTAAAAAIAESLTEMGIPVPLEPQPIDDAEAAHA
jgi:2-aminoethylphosphonate-pyruvate transaminase